MNSDAFVTVFTPSFNRGPLLISLFNSLNEQTCKRFEWVIINDGSIDDTDDIVNNLINQPHIFPITYKKKENGGKHRAINDGIKIAKGKLFFIVDSDDQLTPDAIQKILFWHSTLDKSHKWAGIAGLKGFTKDIHVGEKNSKPYIDAKNTDRKKLHLIGDKAEIYFTNVLRHYPFPEFDGEKFITEEVVWNAIARDNFYIRWFSEIIYICDYRSDGLTKNNIALNKQNPKGLCYWAKQKIACNPNFIEKMLAIKCYHSAVYESTSNKIIAQNLGISKCFLWITLFASKVSSILHRKCT